MFHSAPSLSRVALSLSLVLMAGCASPIAPAPTEIAPAGTETPATVTQPAGPDAAVPTAAARSFHGTATFRGEPLAGYALQVLDGQTGQPVPVVETLAGATGLAVLKQSMLTDAQGRFTLEVAGLVAGKALRVVAIAGNAHLETLVTGTGSLGTVAAQRRVLEGSDTLTLNEVTTALAGIARGVLFTTYVLTPEAAAPVLGDLLAKLARLSDRLERLLSSQPDLANRVVDLDNEEALRSLVVNAGELQALTRDVAELVAAVAKASKGDAGPAGQHPDVLAALARVEFLGTVLAGAFDGASRNFTLINAMTGGSIDAATGDVPGLTARVTGRSGSAAGVSLAAIAAPAPFDEDTTLMIPGIEATLIRLDGPITYTVTSNVGGTGSVTAGVLSWTPPANYNGTATLTVRASAGESFAEQTVEVVINPVNDAPYTDFPLSVTVGFGQAVVIYPFDPDSGDTPTIVFASPVLPPAMEQATSDNGINYYPPQTAGTYTFSYTLSDGIVSQTYTQTVIVDPNSGL